MSVAHDDIAGSLMPEIQITAVNSPAIAVRSDPGRPVHYAGVVDIAFFRSGVANENFPGRLFDFPHFRNVISRFIFAVMMQSDVFAVGNPGVVPVVLRLCDRCGSFPAFGEGFFVFDISVEQSVPEVVLVVEIGGYAGNNVILIIAAVHEQGKTDVFQISHAAGFQRGESGFVQCRQQHTGKNCNDSNNNEEFYQCKPQRLTLQA